MPHDKRKKQLTASIPANLLTEMARPRMAKSVKIAPLDLRITRTSELPSVSVSGSVDRIIPSQSASQPEKLQITVTGDESHQKLRIENELTDENGDVVKLRKRASVEVTVTPKAIA